MARQKVIVIVGPTASGKSAYAVKLARKIGGEVISADSRQVYRGLNIGTGKITRREMKGVPHHMIDVRRPSSVFTAADFVKLGRKQIDDILKRGKVPIICGGTGFYIDALLGRVTLPNVPPNPKLRRQLAKKSASELFTLLKTLDKRRAKNIDRHNPVRLIRAIEIVKKIGRVPPTVILRDREVQPYVSNGVRRDVQWIGLKPSDKILRVKIRTRLLQRMKAGMVREARNLHKQGLSYKRMHELGLEYRYLALFLQNKMSRKEMLRQLESGIWDYSRRQMRYWKRNPDIKWRTK